MTIEENNSRLFRIRGEGTLDRAYSTDDTSIAVQHGRLLYLVRLEIGSKGHPDIKEDIFHLNVITPRSGQYWAKGLGGGTRGWSGPVHKFEDLIEDTQFPDNRATEAIKDGAIKDALDDILKGYNYNCNFKLYSEHDGGRDGPGSDFSKQKTYLPIIIQAIGEVKSVL